MVGHGNAGAVLASVLPPPGCARNSVRNARAVNQKEMQGRYRADQRSTRDLDVEDKELRQALDIQQTARQHATVHMVGADLTANSRFKLL